MDKQQHNNEIVSSRVGGFGSSDAKMFYKIGTKGIESLNNTDKRRISVAKGLIEYKPIPQNEAMKKGHDFEDWYERELIGKSYWREYKAEFERSKNFSTFAHIDYYLIGSSTALELKCVEKPEKARNDYEAQLQWFYMLGALKVQLVVCDSTKDTLSEGLKDPIDIQIDSKFIAKLEKGIKILDENWETIDLSIGDEWTDDDLLAFEKDEILLFADYLSQIKKLEEEAEKHRANIKEMMLASGANSIKSGFYNVTLVPESTTSTFDKKKLLADYPEIDESLYTKKSKKQPYIKFTLK